MLFRSWDPGYDDDDDDEDPAGYSKYEDEDDEDEEGEPGPLLPGLYRALYTFEPEGATEMALSEGQIVRVVGRGGGVGWAIAVREWVSADEKETTGVHALVPESYLEVVQLDGIDDDEGDEQEDEEKPELKYGVGAA